ncbi:MAG TPA: 50S ribosomal protein L30 [Terriglobia bacterium]|nr:50S ribosomal protein L30 [Terriglobia bacterium]
MAKVDQSTVRIKWVRSGIAFNRKQAEVVRALGLRRLQQVVERLDTPVVRGLIAKVPHLVEVVQAAKPPAWTTTPEYTIVAPAPRRENPTPAEPASEPAASAPEPVEAATVEPEAAGSEPQAESKPKRRARTPKAKAEADKTAAPEAKD